MIHPFWVMFSFPFDIIPRGVSKSKVAAPAIFLVLQAPRPPASLIELLLYDNPNRGRKVQYLSTSPNAPGLVKRSSLRKAVPQPRYSDPLLLPSIPFRALLRTTGHDPLTPP